MHRAFAALIPLALAPTLLAACATARSVEAEPASAGAADLVDPPFTAEQIRGATRAGRTYEFDAVEAGGPPVVLRLRFVEVSAEGAVLERAALDASGAPIAPVASSTVTWAELVKHAAWPRSATTVEPAQIEVPAGQFADALLYTVREVEDGKPRVTRAWFARSLPGAPVLHVVELDGREVSRMSLRAHTAP